MYTTCYTKNSVTTPIRIVYDCSCRGSSNSASLNDCPTTGPTFLNNLCSILLRFRTHAFALSTDIEKAFLHVRLHPSDRNFTRFLWPSTVESSSTEFHFVLHGPIWSFQFTLHAWSSAGFTLVNFSSTSRIRHAKQSLCGQRSFWLQHWGRDPSILFSV